jgi:hypothetical protein
LATQRIERRLAAMLSAEIAGYGRLMEADEEGTLAWPKAHRREPIDAKISELGGRIVKTTGDEILIEFPSVVEAVSRALAVQQGMTEPNVGTPRGEADRISDRRQAWRRGDITEGSPSTCLTVTSVNPASAKNSNAFCSPHIAPRPSPFLANTSCAPFFEIVPPIKKGGQISAAAGALEERQFS